MKIQEFRPRAIRRILRQHPPENIKSMAQDTVHDDLGLGSTPENAARREKQIRDAKKTILLVDKLEGRP
jgi:hypothetical protein